MRGIINDTLYETPEGDIMPATLALAKSDESILVLTAGTEGRFIEGLFTTKDGDEYLVPEGFVDITDEDDDESPNEEEDADLPDEDDEEE